MPTMKKIQNKNLFTIREIIDVDFETDEDPKMKIEN